MITMFESVDVGKLKNEVRVELESLCRWWLCHAVDEHHGGYYGAVSEKNEPLPNFPKSLILHTRVLWFFSTCAHKLQNEEYLQEVRRGFRYLKAHFLDEKNGGFLWLLNNENGVVDQRKQVYGQAFAIYALAACYRATGDVEALDLAIASFELLEKHAKDQQFGGYLEAFSQTWGAIDDIRLSEKEDNSPKTMNTNLHVLEAYTELLEVAEGVQIQPKIKAALSELLGVYCTQVYNQQTGHLNMFMDLDWRDHSRHFSFGHDIESSWLILKAIAVLGDSHQQSSLGVATQLAEQCLRKGLDERGRAIDEQDIENGEFSASAWWVQAEAMVGLGYAWASSKNQDYLLAIENIWQDLKLNYIDSEYGEWHWFAKGEREFENIGYKVGPWKGPYHSGRALMQLTHLL